MNEKKNEQKLYFAHCTPKGFSHVYIFIVLKKKVFFSVNIKSEMNGKNFYGKLFNFETKKNLISKSFLQINLKKVF